MNTILMLDKNPPCVFSDSMLDELQDALEDRDFTVIMPESDEDLLDILKMDARVCAVIYDLDSWKLDFARKVSDINDRLPIFAMVDRKTAINAHLGDVALNVNFFEYRLQTGEDLAARIENAVKAYINKIVPPFTKALMKYVDDKKYAFCTPGHLGGSAFLKSPVGSVFHDFFGPNIFQADVSVSMPELGSLLEHSGPHADAEALMAKSFGSDRSYIVTNGTSTANKMVGMFCATDGDTIIVDRNCHKSMTHLMMMVDVHPIYFKPTRNAYGILGGIPKSEFSQETIAAKMKARGITKKPVYAVVTNSTYDGLYYNVEWIKEQEHLKYFHFDSAWVPYTAFNPIYKGKHGMTGEAKKGQVIFETQSTHKLLAAFSQASMVHVKGDFDQDAFNEVFMMHTSTSPQYGIVASAEIATAMMQGNEGKRLISDSIERAIIFRKEIKRLKMEAKDWFFDVWQPDNIDGKPECWELKPGDSWHGFKNQDADHNFLDPIKVTILSPGMGADGKLEKSGIPASIVSAYLDRYGIVVEKTGPYNMLFLFSLGIDEPKAMALLHALAAFKRDYDQNMLVEDMLPDTYAKDPSFYKGMTIQELANGIHALMVKHDLPTMMYHAFDVLPKAPVTPHAAFQRVLRGEAEEIYIDDLKDRINADMILPYPPGVPMIMPGEMITDESKAMLEFLLMLCEIGEKYPGFETEIHGTYRQDDGRYKVKVLKG